MGTILEFRRVADGAEGQVFRERRVAAGSSADIIIFPGVRIERALEDDVLLDTIDERYPGHSDGKGRTKSN